MLTGELGLGVLDDGKVKRIKIDTGNISLIVGICTREVTKNVRTKSNENFCHRITLNAPNASGLVSFVARVNLCPREPQTCASYLMSHFTYVEPSAMSQTKDSQPS